LREKALNSDWAAFRLNLESIPLSSVDHILPTRGKTLIVC
jgi:hypothetical protein